MVSRGLTLLLGCIALLAGTLPAQGAGVTQKSARPIRLVLALVVDQMRPDYLDRFRSEWRGGFAMLLREGIFFRNAEQDHSVTETAPGHATMMTGRSPASVGIVSNDLGVPDLLSPLIGSSATGASPRRFVGTTLFDWMLARDPSMRVLSVSRKDRGAILTIGRAKVPVFWFSRGLFTTSRWYGDTLPTWVTAWNARDAVGHFRGSAWTLERPASSYPEADDRPFELNGSGNLFPHVMPTDWAAAAIEIERQPVMDSLTLDFTLTGVRRLGLGLRDGVDFLSLSLSTTDVVGHRWGPGSREMHDQLLKLDRYLGRFFDSLATIVPPDQMIVTLTADHGITEFPEAGAGARISLSEQVRALNAYGRAKWRLELGAGSEVGLLFGDIDALTRRGVNTDSLADVLAADISQVPGVERVFTHHSLAAAKVNDLVAMRWRRQVPAGFGWFVAAVAKKDYIWNSGKTETSHGTTNPDDVLVPLLFRVPGLAPRRIERTVRTIDLAPTLAALLGIRPTERVEGVPLPELFGRRPTR